MHLGGTELPTSRTTTHPIWCQCDRSKLYRTAGKSGTFPAAPSGSLPPGGPATKQRQRRWDLRARGVSLSCRRTPDLHACLADLFHLGLGFGLGSDHVFLVHLLKSRLRRATPLRVELLFDDAFLV